MSKILLSGNSTNTIGEILEVDTALKKFTLTGVDLSDSSLEDFAGKNIVLNIFPSLDTSVCATSVRKFNEEAGNLKDTVVLAISADLPFAQARFCELEGIKNVIPLSVFRSPEFGKDYGLLIIDGPLKGFLARAVIIADKTGKVRYTELVPEISREPDYKSALSFLKEKL